MNVIPNIIDLYDEKYIEEYILNNLFFGDAEFQKYIRNFEEVERTDEYVKQLFSGVNNKKIEFEQIEKNFHNIIQSSITNALRPILYECIMKLNNEMNNYGKFIISGGEAFNLNVKKNNRRITPDIDTKFIPLYGKINEEEFENKNSQETETFFKYYYGFILKATEHMWYKALDVILNRLNNPKYYAYIYYNISVRY